MNDILLVQRDDFRVGVQIVARTTAAARRLLLDANYTLCGFDDCDAASAVGSAGSSPAASGEAGPAPASTAETADPWGFNNADAADLPAETAVSADTSS